MEKDTIHVLVADDSMLMRVLIKDILSKDSQLTVVGIANNGQDAFLQAQQLRPDVILMDLNMGEYSGIYGIKQVMRHCPTPILVLSALGNTNMDSIMEALHAGAIDYLNKPAKNSVNLRDIGAELIEKVKETSKANLKRPIGNELHFNTNLHAFDGNLHYNIIAIGASTGGPTAIEEIITNLPANLPVPVLIVQHMPQHFLGSFAERLNKLTPLTIKLAEKGEKLEKGKILLVPGDVNTILKKENNEVIIDFTLDKYKAYNFPSVDSVLLSVAKLYGKNSIGVILTGMGSDGAEGLKAIKEAGGYTIAQSKETCVVYGMPRVAIETGVAIKEVKLKDISGFLVSCLS